MRADPRSFVRSRFRSILLSVALLFVAAHAQAAPAELSVSSHVDKMKVAVGEPLTFSVTIAGPIKTAPKVNVDSFEGFRVMTTGQSQQVNIRQGQMQVAVTLQYLLLAEEPGTHKLGPVTVDHQGERYTASAIQVEVIANPHRIVPEKKSAPRRPRIQGGTIL